MRKVERSEHQIPNHEESGEVLVRRFRCGAVMPAMEYRTGDDSELQQLQGKRLRGDEGVASRQAFELIHSHRDPQKSRHDQHNHADENPDQNLAEGGCVRV